MSLTEIISCEKIDGQRIFKGKEKDFLYNYFPLENGGRPKGIMFIMHGYGGDVNQWNERAIQARKSMPDLAVISIEAPIELPHIYQKTYSEGVRKGYAWANMETPLQQVFSIADHAIGGMAVYRKINRFIKRTLKGHNLKPENACVMGCSLGGLIGLPTALRNKKPYGLAVGAITSVLPFTKARSKTPIYMMSVKGDEHFDKTVTPIDENAKGLDKIFNKMAHDGDALLNIDTATERLEKLGVPHKSKIYDVHWEKEPLYTIKSEPILDENNEQKFGHTHHRVSVKMWSDALKEVSDALAVKTTPYIDDMVALGETGTNPQLTL